MSSMAKISTSSTSDTFNALLDPTTLAEFNCFLIFVGGPGYDGGGSCTVSDGSRFTLGGFAGGVPSGQNVEMIVPSGSGRTIYLIGFRASSATYCTDFHSGMNMSQLSQPFVVANTTVDLAPGDVSIGLTPAYSMAKVTDCRFTSSGSPAGGGYTGSGADGDLTSAGSVNLTSTLNEAGTRYLMSYSRVTQILSHGNGTAQVTVTNSSWNSAGATHVGVNDEIMLFAAGASQVTGSGCGSLHAGFSLSGKVTASTSGNTGHVFSMQISDSRWLQIPSTNLNNSGVGVGEFCRVEAIRVPNLKNITLATGTLTLTTGAVGGYNFSDAEQTILGILPLRISGSVNVGAGATLTVDASGRGYKGGVSTASRGQSDLGKPSGSGSSLLNVSGGGGTASGSVSCGGGHGGTGGCASAGGIGGLMGDVYGCGSNSPDATMSCLMGKFFYGGGGGGMMSGGTGGGAIRWYAQDAQIAGTLNLFSNGADGASSGDGGGAGGSIFASFGNLAGSGMFNFNANGGSGQFTGGTGGGGRIHLEVHGQSSIVSRNVSTARGTSGDTNGSVANGTCKAVGMSVPGC